MSFAIPGFASHNLLPASVCRLTALALFLAGRNTSLPTTVSQIDHGAYHLPVLWHFDYGWLRIFPSATAVIILSGLCAARFPRRPLCPPPKLHKSILMRPRNSSMLHTSPIQPLTLAQNRAVKRLCPFPDDSDKMGQTKLPRTASTSEAISEDKLKVLQQAAMILNLPMENLLSASSRSANDEPQITQQQPTSRVELEDLEPEDARDDNPASPPEDSDKDGSDGVIEWQASAAEFRDIDDDIAPDSHVDFSDFWIEDAFHAGPPTSQILAPRVPASGFIELGTSLSMSTGWGQQPTEQVGTPHLAAPPPMPLEGSVRPPQVSSSEVLDSVMVGQASLHQARDTSGWTIVGWQPSGNRQVRQSVEVGQANELQIISVDPLQRHPQPRPQRRKAYEDRERQEDASKTRGLKACVRCRMQKIKCVIVKDNPKGICGTCQAVSQQKLHSLQCLRHRLTESTLYRTNKAPGLEFTFRWPVMKLKDIDNWASQEVRTIFVSSDVCPVPLQLAVRKFVPIPGKDSLHRSWMDYKKGIKKSKETTPYAITDMHKTAQDMREYVSKNIFSCIDFFLRGSDKLVQETYEFARKYMQRTDSDEERMLLGKYFRLWFAVRRTATMEHIVGEETLDMAPEMADRTCPLFGKIPLPPVMIQQLDMILTLGILQPLQKQVLEDFQKLVLANNPKNWMTVYLITFMSLHSCAKISEENYRNARKQGLLRRYSIPNFIQERHHAANVFLSHYHYRTESANPFEQDWRKRHETPFSHMSVDEIHFLEQTKTMVKEREPIIKINNENELYEHELYFVAQMFEKGWQPRDTVIDRTERTVNNVGLKKFG